MLARLGGGRVGPSAVDEHWHLFRLAIVVEQRAAALDQLRHRLLARCLATEVAASNELPRGGERHVDVRRLLFIVIGFLICLI